jgi:hypothetical protein
LKLNIEVLRDNDVNKFKILDRRQFENVAAAPK